MKRTLSWTVTLVMLLAAATVWAFGAVGSTEEPAAGQTVYIAGNPDLYPIEYYDSEMKSYQGMLPELYAALSEETGIEFTYIRAGKKNQQSRMAKNKQVEIVSAHVKGQVEDLLIGTLYSQYATRHTKISGEATIDTGGLALRREANQGDAVFIVTGETQNLKNCCGEITIVELSRDEYKRENE